MTFIEVPSIDFLLKAGLIYKVNGIHLDAYVLADLGLYFNSFERDDLIGKDRRRLYSIIGLARKCESMKFSNKILNLKHRGQEYNVECFTNRKNITEQNRNDYRLPIRFGNYNSSLQDGVLSLPPFFVEDLFMFHAIAQKEITQEIKKPEKVYDFY